MKKTTSLLLCILFLLGASLPVFSMGTESFVQLIHIKKGNSFDLQTTQFYATFADALENAESGDVIEVFADLTVSAPIVIPAGMELTVVSGTKRENTAIFGRSAFVYTDPDATTRTLTKKFNGSLFSIGENSAVTFENITLDGGGKSGTAGGLIYAGSGSTLTIRRGVTLKNAALGNDSRGGAIYAEKDASVSVEDTAFSGNSATRGRDIFAEQRQDLTVADGIAADIAYPETVNINALSLVLSGEIGLVFHTVVPQEFEGGTFVLTCRTKEPKTLAIRDCEKDGEGRYLAVFHPGAIELSEPVTLTVYDAEGNALTSKENSVEGYGRLLLQTEDVTDAERDVIEKLLNYGHYAQIECAAYNGWEIGMDFAATEKYADLTTADSAFDGFGFEDEGYDPTVLGYAVQLSLDYKTDLLLHVNASQIPAVTVNGAQAEVLPGEPDGYEYLIRIDGISALDLEKEFAVVFNETETLTVSVASYFGLAVKNGNKSNCDSVKALYEFYCATLRYREAIAG